MRNTTFKTFLDKYTSKHVPDQSIIHKKCVSVLYNDIIDRICEEIGEGLPYMFQLMKLQTSTGRYVANVLVGLMHEDKCSMSY